MSVGAVLAPFTGGTSLLIEQAIKGQDSIGAPGATPAPDEASIEAKAKEQERQKRRLIAQRNQNIKTTPLGAKIADNYLGGQSVTGA